MTENMYTKLRGMISEDRYKHSTGVQKTAISLAEKYGGDVCKASIAGLIHDCAKGFSDSELLKLAEEFDIEIDEIFRIQPGLLHGPVGAFIVQKEFFINDCDIIHSVKYHTTGCENMSLLDKIIYVADYIEPGRNFKGVDVLRNLTYNDINQGVLAALDSTIKHVMDKNELLDILTIKARNYMLMEYGLKGYIFPHY